MIPPVYSCLTCGKTDIKEEELSGLGQIYSVVTADMPGLGFEELAPYVLAAVQVEDGLLVTARLEMEAGVTPSIGDKVLFVSADERRYVFRLSGKGKR
jgi:uncharacterized OB-fold protein